LGTMLPQAGGFYVYARKAIGDEAGFIVGWCDWFAKCTALAYISRTFGEYLIKLFPRVGISETMMAVLVLMGFVLLQQKGISLSSQAQKLTSALKALAFLVLIVACFAFGTGGAFSESGGGNAHPDWLALFVAFVISFQMVTITFDGYQGAIYFAEEDRDPGRNLPRSMMGGVFAVSVIYLLMNLALLFFLPLSQLAHSSLPAADAMRAIFGENGEKFITVLALLSLIPLIHAILLISTRILFALSRDGLSFPAFATINQGGTPVSALLLTALAAILLVLSGTFERLVGIAAFFITMINLSTFAALLILRWRFPSISRPFRIRGYPLLPLLMLLGTFGFLLGTIFADLGDSLFAIFFASLSLMLYRAIRKRNDSRAFGK
jgi:APA family basic amino acid/polyamine antiporter